MKREGLDCDVYGVKHDAERFTITLSRDGDNINHVLFKLVDFCPRALERAKRLIEKACQPPNPRKKAT